MALYKWGKTDYKQRLMHFKTGVFKMYRIETTDPITGKSLTRLNDMPFVIEDVEDDSLIIYFESERNRDLYLENPAQHELKHYSRRG